METEIENNKKAKTVKTAKKTVKDKTMKPKSTDKITEKKKIDVPEYLKAYRKNAIEDCKLLFDGMNRCGRKAFGPLVPISFGWEHGHGWNREVASLSYKLEALNLLFYPKYGIKIEAMQVKEKFGELEFYYDMRCDSPKIFRLFSDFFAWVGGALRGKVNFDMKRVVDVKAYVSEEWEEISKEDYDSRRAREYVSNDYGWKFKEENGKYYRNYALHHMDKAHLEPTKHKFRYWLSEGMRKLSFLTDFSFLWKPSEAHSVVRNFMEDMADELIAETRRRCFNVCEDCGRDIGTKDSPRYRTKGWIRFLCGRCAKNGRSKNEYVKV